MTLNDLALKYGSDKSSKGHNYCPFYEQTLPKNPKRLLEIGCLHGASARMWREWFPETEVHVLDLFEENPIPDIPGVIFHKGDQRDWKILEELRKLDFDVIIDDGGHLSRAQMMTFYGLFNGKSYYIEDLQCCMEDFYRDGLPEYITAASLFQRVNIKGLNIPFEIEFANNIVMIKNAHVCQNP